MRFNYNAYGAQDERQEQLSIQDTQEEKILERQGNDAHRLYNSLPEGTDAIFSPRINEIFGELFDTGDEVDEMVNDLLHKLCLCQVQRRQA